MENPVNNVSKWQYRDGIDLFRPPITVDLFNYYATTFINASKMILAAKRRNIKVYEAVAAFGELDNEDMTKFKTWFGRQMANGSFKYEIAIKKTIKRLKQTDIPNTVNTIHYTKLNLTPNEIEIIKTTNTLIKIDRLRKVVLKTKIDIKLFWKQVNTMVLMYFPNNPYAMEKAKICFFLHKKQKMKRRVYAGYLINSRDQSLEQLYLIGKKALEDISSFHSAIELNKNALFLSRKLKNVNVAKEIEKLNTIPLAEILGVDDSTFNPEENPFL
ncbi:MAG TPA: hypothetical protein DCF44_12495 [Chitinophagaceae bacterium]|nr:hypothetical protein [Chitinophagaceae bacterium]